MPHTDNPWARTPIGSPDPASGHDPISRPVHYTQSALELKHVVFAWDLNWAEGNVLKYLRRYKHKGDPIQDLKKAREYLDMLIQYEEERNATQRRSG